MALSWWSRRHATAPDVPLDKGERVLTRALGVDSRALVATDRALLVSEPATTPGDGAEPAAGWSRIPWTDVTRARYDDESESLWVEQLTPAGVARTHRFPVAAPSELPTTVWERVTASIVVSRHVRLSTGTGVRVVARRSPGVPDPTWQLVFDRQEDAEDPRVAAEADAALEDLRRQTLP